MELRLPLGDGLALEIADQPGGVAYPTALLQKGLLLRQEGRDLAEEGVGFGVPILKRGPQTIFPGGVQLAQRRDGGRQVITATFRMNLVERLRNAEDQAPSSRAFYMVRDLLAALHRRSPALRGLLTAVSNTMRRRYRWVTTFEETASGALLAVSYDVEGDHTSIRIAVDTTGVSGQGFSEVIIMNELGARNFDTYLDSDGARLRGRRIGTWNEVSAAHACFAGTASGVAFCVRRAEGAKLYRGRELEGSRLAWAGFGYSLRPRGQTFVHEVRIERAP